MGLSKREKRESGALEDDADGNSFSVEWDDNAAAYVRGIFDLNRYEIESVLEEDPLPKEGDRTIKHMEMGTIECCYRWREDQHRLLYEVFEDSQVVYIFDAGPRETVYQGWW